MPPKNRLRASAFERRQKEEIIRANRIIVLAVEGAQTEPGYFAGLNDMLAEQSTILRVEVLEHTGTLHYSSPQQVFNLLKEYDDLVNGNILPEEALASLKAFASDEDIAKYLAGEALDEAMARKIETTLENDGIDLPYRKHLLENAPQTDHVGIVIDRDKNSNSKERLDELREECGKRNYGFYISNPCFEFWLLLHLVDVKSECSEELDKIFENERVSSHHSFVSKMVSDKAGHGKKLSPELFKARYWPQISKAVERDGDFARQADEIMDAIGTNLPDLIKILGTCDMDSDNGEPDCAKE